MDQSAKTLGQLIFLFFAIFLILSIIVFYFVAANARSAAYSIVEYIEIRGLDSVGLATIEDFADKENIEVEVSPVDEGIYVAGGKQRYRVDVSFDHIFSVLNFKRKTTYTLYTRAVEY